MGGAGVVTVIIENLMVDPPATEAIFTNLGRPH